VQIDFGDGTVQTYSPITLPFAQVHTWTSAGQKTITATGQNGCQGLAATALTVGAPNEPPAVTLTSPAGGASAAAPASFSLAATATDSDGTIASVKFYAGSTLLATDATAPYSFPWTGVPQGSYTLTAVATDNGGALTTSSAVAVTVTANGVPTVTLTAPATGAIPASTPVTFSATASDPDGITKVEFLSNGAWLLETDTTAPYGFTRSDMPTGVHAITAKAYDGYGSVNTSAAATLTVWHLATVSVSPGAVQVGHPAEVTVTGNGNCAAIEIDFGDGTVTPYALSPPAGLPFTAAHVWTTGGQKAITVTGQSGCMGTLTTPLTVTTPPTVSVTAVTVTPAPAIQGQPVTVTAIGHASCAALLLNYGDGTIEVHELPAGLPFARTHAWAATGAFTVTAIGPGSCTGEVTTGITIATNPPPAVTLTSPAAGTIPASTPVTFTATAADAQGISKVRFYGNAWLIHEDTTAPFTYTREDLPVGTYELRARAYGLSAYSAVVKVTVQADGT